MDHFNASLQEIKTRKHSLQLFVPDAAAVREHHASNPSDLPYWSQIWPSAIGLCIFLEEHTALIAGKTVIELAAGLGLPSLLASRYAKSVSVSDYLPEAVNMMKRTIDHNRIGNLDCSLLDWRNIPDQIKADVLLLSDVNYAPEAFENVLDVITRFLFNGTMVILSTPQRLMAKAFIERLLPHVRQQEEIMIEKNGIITPITVFLLQQ